MHLALFYKIYQYLLQFRSLDFMSIFEDIQQRFLVAAFFHLYYTAACKRQYLDNTE